MTEHLSIKKRGLLCKLTLPSIQVRRKHGAESDRVASDNDADSSMVAVTVCLVPKEYAGTMMKLAQRIRDTHRRLSSPWDDSGGRIISLDLMQAHGAALASDIAAYKAEVDNYADNLPAVQEAARLRLGPLYDETAYGSAEDARAKLQPKLVYYPLPDSADFRVDLDSDQIEYIRDELDMHMRDKFEQAVADVRNRIVTVIEQFIERVSNYHETKLPGGKVRVDRTFRDSVVTNIKELLDIVPGLNITNDPEVTRVAQQTRNALCVYEAAALRANAGLRDEVVAKAKELLAKLKR